MMMMMIVVMEMLVEMTVMSENDKDVVLNMRMKFTVRKMKVMKVIFTVMMLLMTPKMMQGR